DRADLCLGVPTVPEGQRETLAHAQHEHLAIDEHFGAPPEAVDEERTGTLDVIDNERDEAQSLVHERIVPASADTGECLRDRLARRDDARVEAEQVQASVEAG